VNSNENKKIRRPTERDASGKEIKILKKVAEKRGELYVLKGKGKKEKKKME